MVEGIRFGDLRISSLLFADDVVLLVSSNHGQTTPQLAAECEGAGMRISTSKSETMVLNQKRVDHPLQGVGEQVLPQVEEFKYLRVLFTRKDRKEQEVDRRIGAAAAVIQALSLLW